MYKHPPEEDQNRVEGTRPVRWPVISMISAVRVAKEAMTMSISYVKFTLNNNEKSSRFNILFQYVYTLK
jgi:hypothetical protein